MDEELIAVVGNCASGKTTLVENLLSKGWRAVNVPQEHSEVRRLWRFKNPTVLVLLSCTLATAQARRQGFAWTEKQLAVQYKRLETAKAECNLYIPTDTLSKQEVAARVESYLHNKGAKK